MPRERLFYLDFIRAIAAIAIVITHYNATFLYMDPPITNCYVIDAYVFNVYIGSFGVSLFLIISGAALMFVYGKGLNLKKFYFKRFKSLYPMFWIAYAVSFLYIYVYNRSWEYTTIPKKNMLLTLIGMDGYLADLLPTFYLVGEWFLGFIVIFYIIFPLLRFLIEKQPVLLAIGCLVIYALLMWKYPMKLYASKNILVRLPELLFGMYFIKYIKKSNLIMAVCGLLVLICNQIFKPEWSQDIQTTYIGIASFLVLVYVAGFVKNKNVHAICAWISKYSYAIFLTHHITIFVFMGKFNLTSMVHLESYMVFFGLCFVIAVSSVILFIVDKYVEKFFALIWRKIRKNNNVENV